MRTLQEAVEELAACMHPDDQRQRGRVESGSMMIRCSDCGSVSYEGQVGGWTRPMLVAHVVGAAR